MKDIDVGDFSNEIFNMSEDKIYDVLENFSSTQTMDKSLTYIFIKAFYIHTLKLYFESEKSNINFDIIYEKYKEALSTYYRKNNIRISDEIINNLLDMFDNSFQMLESLNFKDIKSSYEFRHHIIDSFELLRLILEKKSQNHIRQDLFENFISVFKNEAEKIFEYLKECNIIYTK